MGPLSAVVSGDLTASHQATELFDAANWESLWVKGWWSVKGYDLAAQREGYRVNQPFIWEMVG